MSAIVDRLHVCYQEATRIIVKPTPYSFGGGHPGFGPSRGDNGLVGYDCSGFASAVLKAGGILSIPEARFALDTAEFLHWALPGPGMFLTVLVRNDSEEEHMFLDFHGRTEWKNRYCEAPHTGENVHWFLDAPVSQFSARHWSGA